MNQLESILIVSLLIMWKRVCILSFIYISLALGWSGCTQLDLCQNSTSAVNGTCTAPLVNCTTQNCTRSIEFWLFNPNQWPIKNGAFCFHTWQDILEQHDSDMGSTLFPLPCLHLAKLVITFRLNEKVDAVFGLSLLNLIDSAEFSVLQCCSTERSSNDPFYLELHKTTELLLHEYEEPNTDLAPFCNMSMAPTNDILVVQNITLLVALLGSVGLIIGVSINVFLHYALLCKSKGDREYNESMMMMILQEKFSFYDILPKSIWEDVQDEEVDHVI